MNKDLKVKVFAKRWLNGPLPANFMADLADILEDEDYTAEQRAHQIVWQALKWGMEEDIPTKE
jgi:hypothetical protein